MKEKVDMSGKCVSTVMLLEGNKNNIRVIKRNGQFRKETNKMIWYRFFFLEKNVFLKLV